MHMNREFMLTVISKLEGYGTRLEELHWSASSHGLHVITDDFRDELSDFEDKLAENYMALDELIKPGEVKPVLPESESFKKLLEDIRGVLVSIKREIDSDGMMYSGLCNIVDDFFETVNKYVYLEKITC